MGNYERAQSESYALMGVTLFAEYLDGVAIINFNPTISVNTKNVKLKVGAEKTLTATTIPAGETVTWASSNTSVATVTSAGKITAVATGTATITASITIGEGASAKTYTDTVDVKVITA
ncbi:MAG: Ig-like domain-containing protein [Ruminococcus sp.]|nr:Ig-like domain-containing protein [Ruminococcus sp.]